MAMLRVKVPLLQAWDVDVRLQLMIGSEDAADLASSTPSGGTVVMERLAWPGGAPERGGFGFDGFGEGGFGESGAGLGFGDGEFGDGWFGDNDVPPVTMQKRYRPQNKCAELPVGVRALDGVGNPSDVLETLVQLADPPIGARNLSFESTGDPLEVRLTWDLSPDV